VTSQILEYITLHQDSFVAGSTTKCEGGYCVLTVHFCNDEKKCEDVALNPITRPGGATITARDAERSSAGQLLWKDLEGESKATTIKTWIKENKFGCTADSPYENSQSGPSH
jgi:hypothetical protein